MIDIVRAYDAGPPHGEFRVLVDRLWPRGLTKVHLQLDLWLKEAAPSNDLRRWFHGDRTQWEEFRRRYVAELDANPAALEPILPHLEEREVVLLYSARDTERNNAVVLKEYLEARLEARSVRPGV